MLMLLSFLRFFAYVDTGLNYNEPVLNDLASLKGKLGEVWRFPFYKSDMPNLCPKDVTLEWFKDSETVNCVTTANVWKGSAGFVDYLPAEKYASFTITCNDLTNKGFMLFVGDELLIESNVDTAEQLAKALQKNSSVVDASSDGVDVTITLCQKYANRRITIFEPSGVNGRTLADVDLDNTTAKNCDIDLLFAEVKLPCVEGCYKLALRVGSAVLPLATSQEIFVSADTYGTSLLQFADTSNKFGQKLANATNIIRLPSILTKSAIQYSTNERTLSNGESVRSNTKIYDVIDFYSPKQPLTVQKSLLTAFNFETVKVNGVNVFLKDFKQGDVYNDACSSNFTLWNNTNILQDSKDCLDNCDLASVENINGETMYVISKAGAITEVFDAANFSAGGYCIKIPNVSKVKTLSYILYKNDIKTSFVGDILPLQSARIDIGLCKKENYKVKIYEKFC